MRQIVTSDLPLHYPIGKSESSKAKSLLVHIDLTTTPPPADMEIGPISFSIMPETHMKETRMGKEEEIKLVLDRGYKEIKRSFTTDELARGAGIDVKRFNKAHLDWSAGVPYSFHLGNIEGPQGTFLIEMLKRRGKVSRVLNIGCGPNGFQHANIEALGVDDIVYADNSTSSKGGLSMLEKLQLYLNKYGSSEVNRQFLALDKDDLETIKREIEPGSIGAVIRTGVGKASKSEMEGLKHMLSDDGQLYVSNDIEGQPIGIFLDLAEQYFKDITAFIGHQRYSLVCCGPNLQ